MKTMAYDKAYRFSVRIINFCAKSSDSKTEIYLTEKLLHHGTAVGATLAQAYGATTAIDFSDKISIAYRECQETIFWLSLLNETSQLECDDFQKIKQDAKELGKFLFAILHSSNVFE